MIRYNKKHKIWVGHNMSFKYAEGVESEDMEFYYVEHPWSADKMPPLYVEMPLKDYPNEEVRKELEAWFEDAVFSFYFQKFGPIVLAIIIFPIYLLGVEPPMNWITAFIASVLTYWFFSE